MMLENKSLIEYTSSPSILTYQPVIKCDGQQIIMPFKYGDLGLTKL